MSVKLIRAGMLDSVQDMGRTGYQHIGINPGGAMDRYSAQLANLMVGNELNAPVIELHFPAGVFTFDAAALIALAGADFSPSVNGQTVPGNQPLVVNKDSSLAFREKRRGARCYLAIKNIEVPRWLGSSSTNLKIAAALKHDDIVAVRDATDYSGFLNGAAWSALSWRTEPEIVSDDSIRILQGNEFEWLNERSRECLTAGIFRISNSADRMGYQLEGEKLELTTGSELVSTGVSFGTVQFLPSGTLTILMADHQSTGGYPRLGHVISADLPKLAQMQPGDQLKFSFTDLVTAEQLIRQQQQHLLQLKNACKLRLAAVFG
ncbi:MAG TPA: biotin-dependent carboxyltransferase family protein [Chitinophagaceae bacterium]|nr:biotin-dependent carboxyltransferase family protein [Chitinophagaceae bacterium]